MKTGDRIERIYWTAKPSGQQESLCDTPVQTLHYQEDYHGDHSECWVVLTRDGVEVARHNTRYIESIVWKP